MPETLAGYMGGRYAQINLVLRGLGSPNATHSARVASYNTMLNDIAGMEAELLARPRVAQGTILYRRAGMIGDFKTLSGGDYQTGEVWRDAAFLSTSRREAYKTPQGQFQLVMEITCSENSRAHDVAAVSGNDAEAEVLFERGTRFLINSVKPKNAGNVLWVMTELTGS